MKTFKQYLKESTHPPVDNWNELLKTNKMLSTGVRLLREIEALGGEALIVGGSVRDIVLGTSIKDVDITTNVPLEKIKQKFKWNDIGGSGQFGITMVHFGGYEFEVANYRSDSTTSADNRRPDSVSMINTFEGDSARRDITINSMGINSKGELVDYQGGLEDLKKGIIRAVGKPHDRFTEDALRILRTARFASKYGFKIQDETKNAMSDLGHLVDSVSKERIQDEIKKVSSSGPHLANYIEHLDSTGLLKRILPEVSALRGKTQDPKHHPEGDAFSHTIAALKNSRSNNPVANISILFHDLGKGLGETGKGSSGHPQYHGHEIESKRLAGDIGKRLKFPRDLITAIEFAAENHMRTHYIRDMSKKKISDLVNNPNWSILKDVVYADELSRGDIGKGGIEEFEAKIKYAEDIAAEISKGQGQQGVKDSLKEKIDGYKVMKWTGVKPGQVLGTILDMTRDWLYNNINANESDIKEFVLSTYNSLKSKAPPSLEECYCTLLNTYINK